MQKCFLLTLLMVFGLTISWAQTEEDIAESYFKRGEFKKALISYEGLNSGPQFNYKYIFRLIEIHQQLEQFDEAETLINKALTRSRYPILIIELGYNYQLQNKTEQAQFYYEEAIKSIDENPNYIYGMAKKFEDRSLLKEAIRVYKKGVIHKPEQDFSIQLARIYGDLGEIENMFSEYINYIAYRPEALNTIKRAITDFITEDSTNKNNIYLRRSLLKKLQQDPSPYWYDMLSWLYVQEKAYNKSFVQEKAIYKRSLESLNRIYELAIIAHLDNDNDIAKTIFNYVIENTQDATTALNAYQYILEINTKNADDKGLIAIEKEYLRLFNDFGKSTLTLPLQLAYAKFLAFNKKDTTAAKAFLRQSLKLNISKLQQAEVKLLLADILVLQEKFNEALIFYSQIQANLKNSTISQEARFKVAKTSYYKGDFDWAESQLKILKSSTSQLIANDALNLKLLISDNKLEDSTQTALKYYAKADLLAFQNKTDEAITLLDKLLNEHNGESITDEALYQQAKLFEIKENYTRAEANYIKIINDYREGILVDDAYYHLAKLYDTVLAQPEKAKINYETIIFEHEDSIYFIEARKKYRLLRGDSIN